eukprot:1981818-Amphidinium_carterae.1
MWAERHGTLLVSGLGWPSNFGCFTMQLSTLWTLRPKDAAVRDFQWADPICRTQWPRKCGMETPRPTTFFGTP